MSNLIFSKMVYNKSKKTGLLTYSILISIIIIILLFIFAILKTFPVQAEVMPFDNSKFITLDGIQLHYRVFCGEAEKNAGKVLLIHGMGGSTFCWRENINFLVENGYTVVAVDLPAFGYSDRQPGLNHSGQNRARLVWKLLDYLDEKELNTTQKWSLVGHSAGGRTIIEMVLQHQEKVRDLIMIGAAVYNTSPKAGSLTEYWPINYLFEFVLDRILLRRYLINRALISAYGRELTPHELEGYVNPLQKKGTARAWLDLIQRESPAVTGLEQIEQPVLLIWGEHDSWVKPEDGQRLRNELANAELEIIKDSFHMPMVTDAQQVNKMIVEFFKRGVH